MNHIAKQNVPTAMGIVFSNVGLMLDPTQVQMWMAIVSGGAGVLTVLVTFYNFYTKQRIMKKSELKTDLEIEKAELEVQILKKELLNDH